MSAAALEKYLPMYLDQDCYKVVTGGVPETKQLRESSLLSTALLLVDAMCIEHSLDQQTLNPKP
jgi:hypothetical protein